MHCVVFLFHCKSPVPASPAETPKIALWGQLSHCELSLAQVSQPEAAILRSCPKNETWPGGPRT